MKDIREKIIENKNVKNIYNKYKSLTSYINFPTKHSKYVLIIYIITALIAFAVSVNGRYNQYDVWKENKADYFYNDTPMMTTLDAYKYIRHAKEINNNEYVPGGNDVKIFYPEGVPFYDPAPLLSVMLAKLHNITGYDYYNIATNMVPWLSSIFILVLCAYFYIIGYPAIGLVAGLLTSFSPVFMSRSSIGRFDTDGGNMFFLFLAALFIYLASNAKKERMLYIYSALLGVTILGFQHFYNHILFNLVFFLVFIFSLFIYKIPYKKILIAAVTYIITSNPVAFAMSLNSLIGSMAVYIPFLPNNLEATSPIPWVYNTISEAASQPFSGIVAFTTQNPVTFIAGLAFGILFLIANIKKTIGLLPIFATGLMVFVSSARFAMFLMPFIAIGYGYIIYIISKYIIDKFGKNIEKRIDFTQAMMPLVLSFFMLSILFGSNQTAYRLVPAPSINTNIYKDISELKNILPDNSTIYTWWDYGLAIADITGFSVYHSGMSQSTPKTWMIARSFTSNQQTLHNIASFIEQGGYEKVMSMFDNKSSVSDVENTMDTFSKGPKNNNNYILFTYDMIQKYSALSYFSKKDEGIIQIVCVDPNKSGMLMCQSPLDASNRFDIKFDLNQGIIYMGSNAVPLSSIIYTNKGKNINTKTFSLTKGFNAVVEKEDNVAAVYIVSSDVVNTSFVQLFLLKDNNPDLFELVYDNYPYSVVYRLK